jgi:hypothetical protein
MESDDNDDSSRDDAPFYMAFEHSSFRELKLGLSDNKIILDIPLN